jgi:hypothetical protein
MEAMEVLLKAPSRSFDKLVHIAGTGTSHVEVHYSSGMFKDLVSADHFRSCSTKN